MRAASKLNVSQPAISGQVRQLEETLGFELFTRTPRGVEVTELGRRYLVEAEKVQSASLDLEDTVSRLRRGMAGKFPVGIVPGIANNILPALVPAVDKFKPNVRLEVVTSTAQRIYLMLLEGRLDIGFIVGVGEDYLPSELIGEVVARDKLVAIVPNSHPFEVQDGAIDISKLIDEPLIVNELSEGYGDAVMELFARGHVQPNIAKISDNDETTQSLVRVGGETAIIPRQNAKNLKSTEGLTVLELRPEVSVNFILVRLNKANSLSGQDRINKILAQFRSLER